MYAQAFVLETCQSVVNYCAYFPLIPLLLTSIVFMPFDLKMFEAAKTILNKFHQ